MISPFEDEAVRALERAQTRNDREKGAVSPGSGGRFLGGITPHHALAVDMTVRFFERIASPETRRVWLLSPDHFKRAKNHVAVCGGDWETMGRVLEADAQAKSGFSGMRIAERTERWFEREHGIAIHIPLIAKFFPNAAVVPMVLKSDIPDIALLALKNYMLETMGADDVIVLSMDLSHYKTPEGMASEDARTLEVLTKLEAMKTGALDIDARRSAALALRLFKELGAEKGFVLEHTDSSNLLGYRVESGTSYATIIYEKPMR